MNCSNCGTFNNQGSKFCIKCGQALVNNQDGNVVQNQAYQESSFQGMNNNPNPIENNVQSTMNAQPTQTYSQSTTNNPSENPKVSFMEYFFIILAVIMKPFTSFKEELNKFNPFKNSAILSLIVSGTATIVNLITSMLTVVRVKSFNWSSGGYTTTWTWENLKNLDYVKIIGKNFLIYIGIIVAIACVYYIASLIVKKQINFSRLLGISALAVAPMILCTLVLSPLLSIIYAGLGMGVTIVGVVYTLLLLYEGMNSEIVLEGNAKYYLNLICLSILGVAAYYLFMKLFMSSISNGLGDLMDLFG